MGLSDSAQIGICVAIAALLQTVSGATAFSGTFVDDNKLQAKIMTEQKVDEAAASALVDSRRRHQRAVLIVAAVASVIFDCLAIWVTLAS
jgi:hypothetical protein